MNIETFFSQFAENVKSKVAERAVAAESKKSIRLNDLGYSIQFLRGVLSRASYCIPAFNFLVAAKSSSDNKDYSLLVTKKYLEFSALNTITISCRKVFDVSKKNLTGAKFVSNLSEDILMRHALYWSNNSKNSLTEAQSALRFLKLVFEKCSKQDNSLLKADNLLQKRVLLLRQHANNSAAHLSFDEYDISMSDLAHFVGSLTIIGEIIRNFDSPDLGISYFSDINKASYKQAESLFSDKSTPNLLESLKDIPTLARDCWQKDHNDGIEIIMDRLPLLTGWH